MNRNLYQPGRKLRRPGVLSEVPIGPQIGLLNHVGRLVAVCQDGTRRSVDALAMAMNEDLE
jgi:hypothetical protein